MFSLISAWTNGWVDNRNAGNLRRRRAHYDVTAMKKLCMSWGWHMLMFVTRFGGRSSQCHIIVLCHGYKMCLGVVIKTHQIPCSNIIWYFVWNDNCTCVNLVEFQLTSTLYDGMAWCKSFPYNWIFVRGIHRSPVDSPHKEPIMLWWFLVVSMNIRLSKQSSCQWFEATWCTCDVIVMVWSYLWWWDCVSCVGIRRCWGRTRHDGPSAEGHSLGNYPSHKG